MNYLQESNFFPHLRLRLCHVFSFRSYTSLVFECRHIHNRVHLVRLQRTFSLAIGGHVRMMMEVTREKIRKMKGRKGARERLMCSNVKQLWIGRRKKGKERQSRWTLERNHKTRVRREFENPLFSFDNGLNDHLSTARFILVWESNLVHKEFPSN